MTSQTRRRGIAAAAVAFVVAGLIPLTAGPAAAAVTLTGPSNPATDATQTYTFSTGGSFVVNPGVYCLAATPGSTAALNADPVTVPDGGAVDVTLTASFPVAGAYTIGMVPALIGGAPCSGTAVSDVFVSGASKDVTAVAAVGNIEVTPATPTIATGGSQAFAIAVTGPTGTALPGRPVTVSGSGRVSIPLTPLGNTSMAGTISYTFTDTAPAASTVYYETLTFRTTDGSGNSLSTNAYVTFINAGAITVNPTTATTPVGGSTLFTGTVTGTGGIIIPGAQVFVASVGRNTYGARLVGVTNAAGQWTYTQADAVPPVSSLLTDTLTFSANGKSVTATITYTPTGTLTAAPATTSVNFGASTTITVTLKNAAGAPVQGTTVTVSGTGRNAFGTTNAGATNASGQVTWTQPDAAGAAVTTPAQSVLTFVAAGLSATATLNYSAPAQPVTVTVNSPSQGSAISSGGYFNVWFTTAGPVPAGTTAYLTLNGLSKSAVVLTGPGKTSFNKIPAEVGNYAVRIGGAEEAPLLATSPSFSLTIIPFQLNGRSGNSFRVLTGNFSAGTVVYLTRNSATVASARVGAKGQPITISAAAINGTYQVWVASNQGRVYGAHAGVITIEG